MNKAIDANKVKDQADIVKTLADRAFWKIDAKVGEMFDEFVARDSLPTHDEYHGKIICRGFYPERREKYDELYYESVEKACELIKREDQLAYQALVEEHGGENDLINDFKFN